MVHIMELDLDVIHAILSHVDPKDVLSLTLTCKAMQEVAMRRHLAHIDLTRCTKGALNAFCSCMTRDARRPQYVSCLAIASWPWSSPSQGATAPHIDPCGRPYGFRAMVWLSFVISRMTQLSRLEWRVGAVRRPALKHLLDAVARIGSLAVVKLSLPRRDLSDVLSYMTSRPHTIMCKLVSDPAGEPWDFLDAVRGFAGARTLSTIVLEVTQATTLTAAGEHGAERGCWPFVENLTIYAYATSRSCVNFSLLSRAFPGVKRLRLRGSDEYFSAGPFAWPSVESLHTTFPVGLTTPVRHVVLDFDTVHAPQRDISRRMLDCLRPLVLECDAGRDMMMSVARSRHSISFLQLHAEGVDHANASEAYKDIINYAGLLADVPLVGLAVLGWLGLRDAGQSMALDVCTRLAGSVPSLRYVGMVWYTHTYAPLEVGRVLDASIWYQVTAGSGPALKPRLASLSGSEGEGVYDALLASQGPPRRR